MNVPPADAQEPTPPMSERLAVATQHLLPKQAITAMAGAVASW